jgi:hypothetical protein
MKNIILILFLLISNVIFAQTMTYSGYVYNAGGLGAQNIPVKLYKRTTPTLNGFTSQTNYNGHSYYRSTGSAYWLDAKSACENMGGHLATISNSSENNFLYTTWPSGWIGYYQDKTGAFYSEPNGGWRWTENYVINGQQADYDVASYTSGIYLNDIKNSINATLYNSPSYTSGSGKYLTFNGVNQYGITGDLSSKFDGVSPNKSNVITLLMWVYPTNNGVILSELGTNSPSSGWHESVFEITGSNTLRVGLWNTSGGITSVSGSITLYAWHMIGLTYDGTTLTGYRDGVSIGSTTFPRAAAYNNGGGEYFAFGLSDITNMGSGAYGNFRLGDFQVYNTLLSLDEMNRNYMSTAWRFGVYPFSNWNGGEPNNSGGEDYIQFVGSGLWNDLPNNYSLPYVIEFDYIVNYTPWVLYKTVYTDATGKYTISESTNPATEWYFQIDISSPTTTLQNSDAIGANTKVIQNNFVSLDYFKYDVNNDGKITISDVYYIYMKKQNVFSNWVSPLPNFRLYTQSQYNTINSSSVDLRSTYPGVTSYTINSPVSGGSANFYIINTGYSNSTNITY